MEYYLAVLAGSFIYILTQLNIILNSPAFEWSIFFKTNLIPFVVNIIAGVAFVYGRDSLQEIYPITFVSAMVLGAGGQAIFKKISMIFDKDMDTYVTLNKKIKL